MGNATNNEEKLNIEPNLEEPQVSIEEEYLEMLKEIKIENPLAKVIKIILQDKITELGLFDYGKNDIDINSLVLKRNDTSDPDLVYYGFWCSYIYKVGMITYRSASIKV